MPHKNKYNRFLWDKNKNSQKSIGISPLLFIIFLNVLIFKETKLPSFFHKNFEYLFYPFVICRVLKTSTLHIKGQKITINLNCFAAAQRPLHPSLNLCHGVDFLILPKVFMYLRCPRCWYHSPAKLGGTLYRVRRTELVVTINVTVLAVAFSVSAPIGRAIEFQSLQQGSFAPLHPLN